MERSYGEFTITGQTLEERPSIVSTKWQEKNYRMKAAREIVVVHGTDNSHNTTQR